jgi:hypothetical protein
MLTAEPDVGQVAQVRVHQRDQAIERIAVTVRPVLEQTRHFAGSGILHERWVDAGIRAI